MHFRLVNYEHQRIWQTFALIFCVICRRVRQMIRIFVFRRFEYGNRDGITCSCYEIHSRPSIWINIRYVAECPAVYRIIFAYNAANLEKFPTIQYCKPNIASNGRWWGWWMLRRAQVWYEKTLNNPCCRTADGSQGMEPAPCPLDCINSTIEFE